MILTKPVPLNECHPTSDNFDFDSNITEESDLQKLKHSTPKISTDEGRMISIKPVQ
jgi:hypothetical protein